MCVDDFNVGHGRWVNLRLHPQGCDGWCLYDGCGDIGGDDCAESDIWSTWREFEIWLGEDLLEVILVILIDEWLGVVRDCFWFVDGGRDEWGTS